MLCVTLFSGLPLLYNPLLPGNYKSLPPLKPGGGGVVVDYAFVPRRVNTTEQQRPVGKNHQKTLLADEK